MASLAVLAELLELPALAEFDPPERAWADRDEVKLLVQQRLLERTTKEWIDLLGTRDVWCAPVQGFEEVAADPQVAHNELLTTVPHPGGGELRVVGVPMRFGETPGTIRSGPPAVGQHTDEVLRESGFTDEEIDGLREEGCI
jgi:crotonobetainyl-CoA:carnitine CoA-transferase CaiB-like acyl-CoA transferase